MLTIAKLEAIKPLPTRKEYPDGKVTGLYFVAQPSGVKSWALRYRVAGKTVKLTLGAYPALDLTAARRKAREALGEVAVGEDPAAQRRAAREAQKAAESADADRVETVAAAFIERYVKRQQGAAWSHETERLIAREIIPAIGAKRMSEIKKPDVHAMLDRIADRAPIVANRTLAVLRRMFNWAIERGIVDASPVDKIKAPSVEQSRDRVLSDDELKLALQAFEAIGWPFGPLAKLLLLTGARLNEIAGARWGEIDVEARTMTIAKERSKNGIAHEIPISDAALRIINGLPRIGGKGDAFVFTTTGKTAVSGFSGAKEAIDKAVAEAQGADAEEIARWTLHDLRRTAASGMAGIGIAPHVVEALLNHKSGTIKGVAAVYNRYSYATEKRQALDAWARRLEAVVSGAEASNIVDLTKARGKI
jgi:integrase